MGHLLPIGTVLQDRYRIASIVGEGATGVVYEAEDMTVPGARWALKEITEADLEEGERRDAMAMFGREASLLKKLNHTGLPKVIESFSREQSHYLVMEYIEGESLHKKSKDRGGKFAHDEILPWMLQVLDILEYLHSQSPPVIFRDLKPSNIMITAGGKVKLVDFGIARLFVPGKMRDTHIMGTPGFSAPEQYGTRQTDRRSDLYSLGATMYFLLSGEDPEGFNFDFPPVSDYNKNIPQWLSTVLGKVLDKEPERRFPSAAVMKAQLTQDLDCTGIQMAAGSPPPASPWWSLNQDIFSNPWKAFSYCLLLLFGSLIPCVGFVFGLLGFVGIAVLAFYSLGSIAYQVFKRDLRRALSSLLLLLATGIVLAIPAALIIPGLYYTMDQNSLMTCKSNLYDIGTALEKYAADNGKKYPPSLDRLTPACLKAIPTCRKAGRDTYSEAYTVNATSRIFTVFCRGSYHKKILGQPDYPQYDSLNKLIHNPHDI